MPFAATSLQNRNFRLFFIGQGLSNLGNMMKQVALGWLVYRLTDSAFLLAIVMFSRELSAFFISPIAGVFADRFNKYQIVVASNFLLLFNSLSLSILCLQDWVNVPLLVMTQIIYGLTSGVEVPTRQAFVNELIVDKSQLTNAIALNSTMFNTARVVGPAIAGLLIPFVGEGYCFLIYAALLIITLIQLSFVSYVPLNRLSPSKKFLPELSEGLHYVYQHKSLRVLFLLIGSVTFFGLSYEILLPVFVAEVYDKGATLYGYLTSAIGLGSIIGALSITRKRGLLGLEVRFFAGVLLFGICMLLFAYTAWVWLSLSILFVAGFGRVTIFTANNTLLQSLADDEKRGRVLSLYVMLFMGAKTLGNFMMGFLAEHISVEFAIFVGGLGCLLSVLWLAGDLQHIREEVKVLEKELNSTAT